jgi:hypothetical protein
MQKIENYLTERDVSEITKFKIQTLRNHRHESRGIPYLKIGRSIRYRTEDVKAHMEKCFVDPEA